MEPDALNSPSADDRKLAALLGPTTPLADVGFSARVLAALPAPRATRVEWRRRILCTLGALTGVAIALPSLPPWPYLARLGQQINQAYTEIPHHPQSALLFGGLALMIAFALFANDREKFRL
jgi:hypothetical protein